MFLKSDPSGQFFLVGFLNCKQRGRFWRQENYAENT